MWRIMCVHFLDLRPTACAYSVAKRFSSRIASRATVRRQGNAGGRCPNLTDQVWLYGSSENTIAETVTKGRNNRMPAFKEFLGEAKVHLLAAYVYGLSQGTARSRIKRCSGSPVSTGEFLEPARQ